MKAYGGLEEKLHSFSTSVLYGGKRSTLCLSRFTPGKTTPVTTDQKAGWAPARYKYFALAGNQTKIRRSSGAHPSHYIHWATPAPKRRWEDNIKMTVHITFFCAWRRVYLYRYFLHKQFSIDLTEIVEGVDWTQLAQDRGRWRTLVTTVMNSRGYKKAGNSWVSWPSIS